MTEGYLPVSISQYADGAIGLMQDSQNCNDPDAYDLIVISPDQAVRLAYRLMSFGKGQGPREKETIE